MRAATLLLLVACAATGATDTRKAAIALVEETAAKSLESPLPDQPLREWLSKLLRVDRLKWEVLDGCGDPRNERPNTRCIATTVPITAGHVISVSFNVGTRAKLADRPVLELVFWDKRDGSDFHELRSLAELQRAVAELRREP